MELTLQQIKELMTYMKELEIDKLEFQGLILTKSRHNSSLNTTPQIDDPAKKLFQAVSEDIPDWIKGNEHKMFANPFSYPDNPNPNKDK